MPAHFVTEPDTTPVGSYVVVDGTQVHLDGVTYSGGEVLQASERTAAPWLLAGYVTAAKTVESKPAKRVSRKAS